MVMIMDICSAPEVLKVMKIVNIVIMAIRIIVPILLILFGSKLFLEAVASKKFDLKETFGKAVRMMISAILIFFVPTFMTIVMDLAEIDYGTCFVNATDEGILNAYYEMSILFVERAEKTKNRGNLQLAREYLNNIESHSGYSELSSRLDDVESYVNIVEAISALKTNNYEENAPIIEEMINNLSDESLKEELLSKLTSKVESLKPKSGSSSSSNMIAGYPVVPFDEIDLYSGLIYMSGVQLSEVLSAHGSSVETVNSKITAAVNSYGVGTREATVAAAMVLIGSVAECGYKLPYYWGGKRSAMGIDGTWGIYKSNPYCSSYSDPSYCSANMSNWAMDCSGFVNWAVCQGKQESLGQSVTNGGSTSITGSDIVLSSATASSAVCNIGDAIVKSGHIMLVVGLDDTNKRYIIAEESGGLELRYVTYDGRKNGASGNTYYCRKLDQNYSN